MFLLRRRATTTTMLAAAGIEDAAGIDLSGASDRRRRTDQVPSDKRSRSKQARRLSENEKARISIYLQILNIVVAALSATLYAVKDHSTILFEIIRTKGLNDLLYLTAAVAVTALLVTVSFALYAIVLLHQALVSALSPMLLVNASFFTLHPHPPLSPSFRTLRRNLSKSELSSVALNAKSSLKLASASSYAQPNALQIDPQPLIDFSSRSSEAGDTPPLPNVLVPAVLSPTQLQLRSLSPAFGASMQQVKERDMEEILQASSRPSMPPYLGAILSKRSDLAPLMFGRPMNADRSMSTVSYPDVYGGSGVSDDEADEDDKMMRGGIYESEQETEEQESPAYLAHVDTDNDFDDGEDGDEITFPLPDVQAEDIPFTSSPSHIALAVAPEMIDVLDPESRQASMDMATSDIVMPMPHPASFSSEESQYPFTPPSSRVATLAQPTTDAVDSPRDIFSPTPVSFPQPVAGLPFAFPFLREQLQQRLASPPSASISQWSHTVAESDKKEDADEHVVEPTPYPSPPFTPPSSRPPTMYSSMALQMPQRDLATEMLSTPDPFIIEHSPLSALVEEAKAELEAVEGSALAMEAPDSVAAEPDTTEPAVVATEAHTESVYKAAISTEAFDQTQVPPSHTETAPEDSSEIQMPVATRGILRNPLSQITQLQNAPPRTISPVKSIGRGGLFDGSRIAVDDFAADSSIVSAADTERTLVASSAEDSLNEVGTIVEQDADVECERHGQRQRSGATSGADDESTAPRAKMDLKKKKKKTKKAKKGVSFDEVPFVIGSDMEQDDDGTDTVLNDVAPTVPLASLPPIPVPKTFEIMEEDDEVPMLLPSNISTEAIRGSPVPSRALSVVSEMMSPRSTADELSDSSAVLPPGQFSAKQVDHYGRWFSRAHRDKALPTIQVLRDQMKACSDVELAGRLRLGSRAAPTKLSKTLVGEDNMKGVGANGSLPPPPVRKASGRRR